MVNAKTDVSMRILEVSAEQVRRHDLPVPMYCRALGGTSDVVTNCNFNHITPVGLQKRAGKLAVHSEQTLLCNADLN